MDDNRPWTWSVDDPRLHFASPEPSEYTYIGMEGIEGELREFMTSRPDLYPPR